MDPVALLSRALDALAALAGERGHLHPPRTQCPPSCREARDVLATAGRLPFGALESHEQAALLHEESTHLRRDVRELAARMRTT